MLDAATADLINVLFNCKRYRGTINRGYLLIQIWRGDKCCSTCSLENCLMMSSPAYNVIRYSGSGNSVTCVLRDTCSVVNNCYIWDKRKINTWFLLIWFFSVPKILKDSTVTTLQCSSGNKRVIVGTFASQHEGCGFSFHTRAFLRGADPVQVPWRNLGPPPSVRTHAR